MKKQIFSSIVVLALALSACSVKKATVPNNPPEIVPPTFKFSVTDGKLRKVTGTAFLWPAHWNEADAEKGAETVNKAASAYQNFGLMAEGAQKKGLALYEDFGAKECMTTYARTPGVYGETEQVEFIELTAVPPEDPGYDEYSRKAAAVNECAKNQQQRLDLFAKAFGFGEQAKAELALIQKTLDKDPANPENWLSIGKGSEVDLLPVRDGNVEKVQVRVLLKSFIHDGRHRSSRESTETPGSPEYQQEEALRIKDASYDAKRRVLMFSVPEEKKVERDGEITFELTGRHYRFDLVRVPNVAEDLKKVVNKPDGSTEEKVGNLAKFKGELSLIENGKAVRKGTAQLVGELFN
jgi:hypothetical protein